MAQNLFRGEAEPNDIACLQLHSLQRTIFTRFLFSHEKSSFNKRLGKLQTRKQKVNRST